MVDSDNPMARSAAEVGAQVGEGVAKALSEALHHRSTGAVRNIDYGGRRQETKADDALPPLAIDNKTENCPLKFDTMVQGRHEVIRSITLPDCDKLTRYTEPLDGRDGQSGMRVLKGYKFNDGTLIEKEIHRNSDATISVMDLNNDGRHPDRHEQRFSEAEFVNWVKEQKAEAKR